MKKLFYAIAALAIVGQCQLMILPVEEKDARDYPELALNSADAP